MPQLMTIEGADRLKLAFQQLGPKLEKKILRKAVRSGIGIILKDAKRRAPRLTGRMAKALTSRTARYAIRQGIVSSNIVFNTKKYPELVTHGKKGQRWFYPAFVEYGTDKMAAQPFVRPAFDSNKEAAANRVIELCWTGVQTEWRG